MISILTQVALFSLTINYVMCDSGSWEYGDQDNWPEQCRNGRMQSPINLPDICYPNSLAKANKRKYLSAGLVSNSTSNSTDRGKSGGSYGNNNGNYGNNNGNYGGNSGNSGGSNNSPIQVDRNLRINLLNYDQQLSNDYLKIKNTGHTISMTLEGSEDHVDREAPMVTGTAAEGQMYQFVEAHFHWDQQDTTGSEHSIAGKRTALEMHLVHYNTRYNNKKEAASKSDGLLVLGVFFREDTKPNPRMKPIIDQIAYVRQTNSTSNAKRSFSLRSILPQDLSTFYKYHGSLTTPPCYESVTWVLLAQAENIGYNQLNSFQQIQSRGDKLRRIQQANGRPIYASSDRHCNEGNTSDEDDDDSSSNGSFSTSRPPYGSAGTGRPSTGQGGFENPNRPGSGSGSNSGRPSGSGGNWGQGGNGQGGNGGYDRPGGQGGQGWQGGQGGQGGYDRPGGPKPSQGGQGGYDRPGNNFGNNNRPSNGNGGYGYLESGRPNRRPGQGGIGPGSGPWSGNRPFRPAFGGPIRFSDEQFDSAIEPNEPDSMLTDTSHSVQIPQPVISFQPVVIPL